MSIKTRPDFNVNVDRTIKLTEKRSVFFKLQPSINVNIRFLPPPADDAPLFFYTGQHFGFTEKGEKRVWACRRINSTDGDNRCPICDLVEAARRSDPEKYADLIDKHKVNEKYQAQVIVVPKDGTSPDQLSIIGFTGWTAGQLSAILAMDRDNRQPLMCNSEAGQLINIKHNGKGGFHSRYVPQSTGVRVPLDELYPKWADEFLNVEEQTNLKIGEYDRLLESLRETVGGAIVGTLLPQT